MMHRSLLILLFGGLIMLTGCKNSPKSMADLKDGSPADSMMYYFGQMQANNYFQDAETDTLLRSEEAREEFMKGFRKALDLDHDNAAYNKGLELGLRLAVRLREFEDRYGVKFPEDVMAASLENALKSYNDPNFNIASAQKGFYKFKDSFELKAAHRDVKAAQGNLSKDAKARGFKMVSDTLYAKDVTPGSGQVFKMGDRVAVEVLVTTLDGEEVVTRQFPDSITLGEGRVPDIVRVGILTMKPGQTRQFMTTPRTLLGKRYQVYKLPPEQPVIFTVKANQGGGNAGATAATPTEVE